ncbi:tRNA (N6-threonylcarbamoyladenosine(37)-N6)-methyltransferase TrmO [Alkalimarinus alittae]|uniref:tRNA (N6-threonylcarbamoyladenosine(37)-N6)-methyltransferase TrmO n=1 Tax=Alkalimarinus alittae TaxID=2961619 RepID=A0ABY6MZF2_9ALTE|nr:tRNA (N6-threonylcarbamoyladenosine(37)-N6)-methyltransferase TrmO [Alkalimarinus alittae]UZE95175.1 tRNA (N6-threonylcarbamoyladenosine(37)-N6)-methyltransferase TrmO [Alkalimarinus alittae]
MSDNQFTLDTIGIIASPFKEKFGIPRQPSLARNITSEIIITPAYNRIEAFKELEQFTHLWLTFIFHQNLRSEWKPSVRPPRLGGNKKIGVFASRSPFRPNNLGLSAVEFVGIRHSQNQISIIIRGADLVDATPIVDIKPYIPYSDSIPNASAGYASEAPCKPLIVIFSALALEQIQALNPKQYPNLTLIIEDVLSADPRPAYKTGQDSKVYGVRLYDIDVKWQVTGEQVEVMSVDKI